MSSEKSSQDLPRSIKERYASTTLSSNLKDDAEHHNTDILIAIALSSDIAYLIFRVKYANDLSSYPQLRTLWEDKVRLKADLRHWPTNVKPERVAKITLEYFLANICDKCDALGYIKHESSPTLTATACPCCDGAKIKPFVCERDIRKYALDVLDELHQCEPNSEDRARKKLGRS